MSYNPEIHHRHSIRLKEYDYTQSGAYFITICTYNREFLFGNIIDGTMRLNEFGLLVESEWLKTAEIRGNVSLDEYVVMPNHIHGIIIINRRGMGHRAPTKESFGKPLPGSIPTIIRSFESTVTKQINKIRRTPGSPIWQRNYYEHVIRDEEELGAIRRYINENPLNWDLDRGTEGGARSSVPLLTSHSPEQTQQVGYAIGALARAGDLILLVGELGAGKTCLTQGIAWGLGFDGYVASPSFMLVREHQGRVNLYHIDFYRLDDIEEIAELGIDDYLYGEGVCVVEWAEKALDLLPSEHLLIKFEHLAKNERRLYFEPKGKRYIEMLAQLKEKWNSL